jgi:hypothetical protein
MPFGQYQTLAMEAPRKNAVRQGPACSYPRVPPDRLRLADSLALEYLRHLPDIAAEMPSAPAVIFVRVSTRTQRKHLREQEAACKGALRALGIQPIRFFHGVTPATSPDAAKLLAAACKFAGERGGFVVAAERSRFIRSADYKCWRQEPTPSESEYKSLMLLAGGVPLATVLPPDAPPGTERGFQTCRGMADPQRRGGRPISRVPGYKKARRQRLRPKASQFRAAGRGLRWISRRLRVAKSTLQYWFKA